MEYPVVVIGAGFSGIAAVKSCLEDGLQVICLEKLNIAGGLWRFREDDFSGVASVMKSTIINTSKEMNAFSDFVPPKDFPNYMHNTKMIQYFENYVDHFKLLPNIRLQHEVLSAQQTSDFNRTGHWKIKVKDLKENREYDIIASALMVCTGHHVYPHIPKFSGLEQFTGQVIHSHSYKDFQGFLDKRVLIIGVGNSGVDIAVELSRVASQVYLSTRRGTWLVNRVGDEGDPRDMQPLRNRFNTSLFKILPDALSSYLAIKRLNRRFDHTKYNLKPNHGLFQAHPTLNDELPNRIISGTVIIKRDIHRFTENAVFFQYEEHVECLIDAVILATGYKIQFPILAEEIIPVCENNVRLYKHVFPPALDPPTLAIIGLVQPIGSIVPISEMQSRLAVQIFQKKIKLPDKLEMIRDIDRVEKARRIRYVDSPRHTIQVDYLPYMDELAEILGVKPDLVSLFYKDPKLWSAIEFGPNVAYQYRLQGPYPWQGARDAILTLWDRVYFPLNPRYSNRSMQVPIHIILVFFIGFLLFAYFVL